MGLLSEDTPHLIVLDLVGNLPVVVVTASPLNLDSLDVACVLRKPVSPDKLVETVRKCLGGRRPA